METLDLGALPVVCRRAAADFISQHLTVDAVDVAGVYPGNFRRRARSWPDPGRGQSVSSAMASGNVDYSCVCRIRVRIAWFAKVF
jgi:hypothetical protein